jgi:ABC-type multidrug transport system permease subunit
MKFITFTHSHNKDDNVIKYFKESIKDYYDYNFGNKIPEIMIICLNIIGVIKISTIILSKNISKNTVVWK